MATTNPFITQVSTNTIPRSQLNFNPQASLDGLKSKLVEAQTLAASPLQSPGAQETLNSIKTQLGNRRNSLIGQAKGRATASGQAGFQGVLANTAAGIEQNYGDALSQSTSDLALQLSKQGRDAESQILALQAQQENEGNRLLLQKYGYDTDFAARQAQLNQSTTLANQANALEQSRLAQQKSQYEGTLAQQKTQFTAGYALQKAQQEATLRQQAFDDALRKLQVGQGLTAQNLLSTSGLNPLAANAGIPGVADVRVNPNKNKTYEQIAEEDRQKQLADNAARFAAKYGTKFTPKEPK